MQAVGQLRFLLHPDDSMPKITFNSLESFLSRHPESFSFKAFISSSLPRDHNIEESGKKLPTPYVLFQEWASRFLSGEWVGIKYKGGLIICVAEANDAALISQTFGATGSLRKFTSG